MTKILLLGCSLLLGVGGVTAFGVHSGLIDCPMGLCGARKCAAPASETPLPDSVVVCAGQACGGSLAKAKGGCSFCGDCACCADGVCLCCGLSCEECCAGGVCDACGEACCGPKAAVKATAKKACCGEGCCDEAKATAVKATAKKACCGEGCCEDKK